VGSFATTLCNHSLLTQHKFQSVTLHTDCGDIKIEVFCEDTPKAAENFLALCASDYYNGCQFIRNIKGFMVQTGNDESQISSDRK
jgi:cyclophilin family peptidyl-prolyl cis-trans isomerase